VQKFLKFIFFNTNNFDCLFYRLSNAIISISPRFCKFGLLHGAERAIDRNTRESTRVPERRTSVRVLEFGQGLSGQIDGHRHNQATSMIPHTLSVQAAPICDFFS